jgi:chorismate synthase
MLRFLTSGESHGACLIAILEGMPKGVGISVPQINYELGRRQKGYGRGGRMTIEKDSCVILSGLQNNKTTGGSIALRIMNRDFKIDELPVIKNPRPGHADLPGLLKYSRKDARDILERASARETAARVACGSICRQLLKRYNVDIVSLVTTIGNVTAGKKELSFSRIRKISEASPVRSCDKKAEKLMIARIDKAKADKDTLGGIFEVQIKGVAEGLGFPDTYGGSLASRLTFGLMSIQAVKGVSIQEGIKGGKASGGVIILRAAMKPIATLMKPLNTINIDTKEASQATVERSDVTAVPACAVVAESMAAIELAKCYLEREHRNDFVADKISS